MKKNFFFCIKKTNELKFGEMKRYRENTNVLILYAMTKRSKLQWKPVQRTIQQKPELKYPENYVVEFFIELTWSQESYAMDITQSNLIVFRSFLLVILKCSSNDDNDVFRWWWTPLELFTSINEAYLETLIFYSLEHPRQTASLIIFWSTKKTHCCPATMGNLQISFIKGGLKFERYPDIEISCYI